LDRPSLFSINKQTLIALILHSSRFFLSLKELLSLGSHAAAWQQGDQMRF
jgi:hypothetical protein